VLILAGILAQACAGLSPSGSDSQWERTFLYPKDRVFAACLESLENTGFRVRSSDASTARISAVPVDVEDFRGAVLEVEVYVRGEITVVELASIGGPSTSFGVRQPEPGASAFLLDLERRLREMAAEGEE
jgi:hypothetical protein